MALTVIQAPSSSTGTTAESESVSPSSTILRAKAPSPSPSSRGGLRATSACVTAPQPPNVSLQFLFLIPLFRPQKERCLYVRMSIFA